MLSLHPAVERELCKIHHERNRVGYFPAFLAIPLSIYFQQGFESLSFAAITSMILVTIGTLLRIVIGEKFRERWEKRDPLIRSLSLLGLFLIGLAWVIHFEDVASQFGGASSHASYVLLIMAAFITGGSTSLVADRASYLVYVLTMSVGVVLVYLYGMMNGKFAGSYIILNIVIFLFFSVSNHKVGFSQLVELLQARLNSDRERDRLESIIDAVPGFVGLFDKDLKVFLVNKTTKSIFPGILGSKIGTIDPFPGTQWEKYIIDFMHTDDQMAVSEQYTEVGGKEIYALLNIQKLEDGGGIVVSIIINELVEARKKIREQEAKSQYTAKLASLGEMAAGIAHEINNPLTIIQGSANIMKKLLEQEPLDGDAFKMLAGKIYDTSDRISKTVRSLKALSRNADNDPMVPVSLKKVIDISVDLCEARFNRGSVELRLPENGTDSTVLGRESQLSQVLVNLLGNAFDAVQNSQEKWVKVEIHDSGKWSDIIVCDSGPGIPENIRNKIMDPFFTTKDVNQGTGLGLSISKSIMHEHGGELSLLSQEKNTTFRMRLPQKR